MKLAYLLCVHQHPQQLLRLIKALDHPASSFFIHVDRKASLPEFADTLKDFSNVQFSDKRFSINRKAWSHVSAWLELMRMSFSSGFRYYSLLSGSDYPIKSTAEIYDFFSGSDREFIAYFNLEDRPDWKFKINEYHYRDLQASVQQADNVVDRNLRRGKLRFRRIISEWRGLVAGARDLPKIPIFGGSEWCSLTHACVQHVLETANRNKALVRFFRHTDAPHEMFFQTILLNSDFRSRLIGIEDYSAKEFWPESRHPWPSPSLNLRYIDWTPQRFTNHGYGSPLRGPAILDERDAESLQRSDALFARKFHPEISRSLLDWIDASLLHKNPIATH